MTRLILASQSIGRKKLLDMLDIPYTILPSNVDEEKIIGKNPIETLKLRAKAKAEHISQQLTNNSQQLIKSNSKRTKTYSLNANPYLILSADSGAIIDNKNLSGNDRLLGKPKDYADGVRILKLLSGKTHKLTTAVTIIIMNNKNTNKERMTQDVAKLSIINFRRSHPERGTKRIWKEFNSNPERIAEQENLLCKKDTTRKLIYKTWQFVDTSLVTFRKLTDDDIKTYLKVSDYTRYAGGYALFAHPNCRKPTLDELLSIHTYETPDKSTSRFPLTASSLLMAHEFITRIRGSLSNVIGLPLEKVIPILEANSLA